MAFKLNNLKYTKGSRKPTKSFARGFGSGRGKTAGRGQKGQHSRNGSGALYGFKGGQRQPYRKLPKYGFTNAYNRTRYAVVTLEQVAIVAKNLPTTEINRETLQQYRAIQKNKLPIKIIGNTSKDKLPALNVSVEKVSEGAKKAIEAAGGKINIVVKEKRANRKEGKKEESKVSE